MSENVSGKKYNKSLSGKVILAFLLGCMAILLSWGITRITFHKILHTVDNLSQPNPKLNLVNNLFLDVVKLDQLQRAQALSTVRPYNPFLKESQQLQLRLDTLMDMSRNNPLQLSRIDSMKVILAERDKLFITYLNIRANLIKNDTVSQKIQALYKIITNPNTTDNIVTTEKKITTTTIRPVDSGHEKSKPSFWSQLLGRRKAEPKMERAVTEELNIQTNVLPFNKEDSMLMSLSKTISDIEANRKDTRNTLISKQKELINAGSILINQLFSILKDIQKEELQHIDAKNKQTTDEVNNTLNRISSILIIFILGTIVLLFLIFTDIVRSNRYRRELIAAKEEAEESGRVKQRFLANISHELRTPLQVIVGMSEQLKMKEHASVKELNILHHSSQHLLQIVNEVLDYSRIISGKYKLEYHNFDMQLLLDDVKNTMQIKAEEKHLQFRYETFIPRNTFYIGDPFRLKQILYNLLGNAIKFTDKGSIALIVECKERAQATQFIFTVKDTGIGISAEDIHNIFNQFEQANVSHLQQREGTGLGLSIVQSLVEAQNGAITVKSEQQKGSEFRVVLTYTKTAGDVHETSRKAETVSIADYQGNIWVVDDDAYILQLFDGILDKYNVTHSIFSSGEEVLNMPFDNVDFVFIDIRMPGMNGFEVCKQLRERYPVMSTKLVALTAQALPDEQAIILEEGFDALLMKPFMEKDLLKILLPDAHHHEETTDADGELPDELKGLMSMLDDDTDQLKRILNTFFEETKEDLTKFKQAVEHASALQAAEELHRMAGRCGQLGMHTPAHRLRAAERTLRADENTVSIQDELYALHNDVSILVTNLHQKVANL